MRFKSDLNPIRAASSTSSAGAPTPVTVVKKEMINIGRLEFGICKSMFGGLLNQSQRVLSKERVGLCERVNVCVFRNRKHKVALHDFAVAMDPIQNGTCAFSWRQPGRKGFGDFRLRMSVGRKRGPLLE